MNDNLLTVANQLALKFSEMSDIPSRFKRDKKKKENQKNNLNTSIETRFQENVQSWKSVIETMLNKMDTRQAWRFLLLKPIVENDINNAVYSKDFTEFTEYLIIRRDNENCSDKELGLLALLHTEFQKEINRVLKEN